VDLTELSTRGDEEMKEKELSSNVDKSVQVGMNMTIQSFNCSIIVGHDGKESSFLQIKLNVTVSA